MKRHALSGAPTRVVSVVVVALACSFSASHGKAVTKPWPPNSVLDALLTPLDRQGIDVAYCCLDALVPDPLRLRVAPLRDMPTDRDPGLNLKRKWVSQFVSGFTAVQAAVEVRLQGPRHPSEKTFRRLSKQHSAGRRVFLSHDASNREEARRVEMALNDLGFVTFTYLNEEGLVRYPPKVVGALLATADHCLVLDSGAARSSRGVGLETRLVKSRLKTELRGEPSAHGQLRQADIVAEVFGLSREQAEIMIARASTGDVAFAMTKSLRPGGHVVKARKERPRGHRYDRAPDTRGEPARPGRK